MKKMIICALVSVVAFTSMVSCQKDVPEVKMVPCTFSVSTVADSFPALAAAGTKVALTGGKSLVWSPGDKFVIFKQMGTSGYDDLVELHEFITRNGGENAVFEGSLPENYGQDDGTYFAVCYKKLAEGDKDSYARFRKTSIRLSLPCLQYASAGGFDTDALVLSASTSNSATVLDFENRTITFDINSALFGVEVKGEGVSVISLSCADSFLTSDVFNLNMSSGGTSSLGQTYGTDSAVIELYPDDAEETFAPGYYYFCVGGAGSAGRSIGKLTVCYTINGAEYAVTSQNDYSVVSGKIYNLPISEEDCALIQ